MYESFYGLKELPFALTPDTEYLYRYSGHQEVLNVLRVALRNGEGFIRVTGEVGTGKTLLCRQLIRLLQSSYAIAYLPNPLLTPLELYQAICSELCLAQPDGASMQQLCQAIFVELVRLREQNLPLVLLIDEAQAMTYRSLEALRLLSNLETEKEKLLHIVFFAQPEFDERLAEYRLRQLRQRITFSYRLKALSRSEVATYLEHRLAVAGNRGGVRFTKRAMTLLFSASGGVPRMVNLLAHKALLVGFGKGRHEIGGRMLRAAIRDTPGVSAGIFVNDLHAALDYSLVAVGAIFVGSVFGVLVALFVLKVWL
jgi:MSHA biogenesis protein MshM